MEGVLENSRHVLVAGKWCVMVETRTALWVGQLHQLVLVGVVINIVIVIIITRAIQVLLMVTRHIKWVMWIFTDSVTQHWYTKWRWEGEIEASCAGSDRTLVFTMGLEILLAERMSVHEEVFCSVQIVDRLLLSSLWNGHICFRPRPAAIIVCSLVHSS